MKEGQWTHSDREDKEAWLAPNFDTVEEAIIDGKYEYAGADFYVGQLRKIGLPIVDVDQILDGVKEHLEDEVGELSDNFLKNASDNKIKKLQSELDFVLHKWLTELGEDEYYRIVNIKKIRSDVSTDRTYIDNILLSEYTTDFLKKFFGYERKLTLEELRRKLRKKEYVIRRKEGISDLLIERDFKFVVSAQTEWFLGYIDIEWGLIHLCDLPIDRHGYLGERIT